MSSRRERVLRLQKRPSISGSAQIRPAKSRGTIPISPWLARVLYSRPDGTLTQQLVTVQTALGICGAVQGTADRRHCVWDIVRAGEWGGADRGEKGVGVGVREQLGVFVVAGVW